MNRAKKFKLNAVTGLLKQFVALACGFILPAYILQSYGSAVNGLVSSITQFLAFITLLEMGVGPVIQSNLYKPLADNDAKTIIYFSDLHCGTCNFLSVCRCRFVRQNFFRLADSDNFGEHFCAIFFRHIAKPSAERRPTFLHTLCPASRNARAKYFG